MTVAFIDTWIPNGPFEIARNGDVRGGMQIAAIADPVTTPVSESGSSASLTDPVIALRADLEGITGVESWMVANALVQLSGTSGGANDGPYAIDSILGPTSVRLIGSFSLPEAANGSLVWEINPVTDAGLLIQGVPTWLREPGMVARVSPTESGVDSLINTASDWELRKNTPVEPEWQDRIQKNALIIPPNALSGSEVSAGAAVHKAHIVHGCGLDHGDLAFSGGFYVSQARVEPGIFMLADGRVVRVNANESVDFGIGGTAASGLDGVAPSFPSFIYYYVYVPSGSDPVLTFSTSGPDSSNRPSSVPVLGDRNDYAYVGILRWHDYRVSISTNAQYELAREARAFESVQNNKRARTVYFSDPYNDANFRQVDLKVTTTAERLITKNFIASNPAPQEFKYVIIDSRIVIDNTDVGAAAGLLLKIGGGVTRRIDVPASGQVVLYERTMSPRSQFAVQSSAAWGILEFLSGAGDYNMLYDQVMVGGVEFVD